MGAECILFSFTPGLFALGAGLYFVVVGRVYLTSWSRKPFLGVKARILGLVCILVAIMYFAVVIWAWSKYDR
jgi:hypothetical protein